MDSNNAALVTGGAKRIGREICLRLADMGYDIVLTYLSSQIEAEGLASEIQSMGRKCAIKRCDLTLSEDVPALMEDVFQEFPQLNLVVNNASLFERCNFADTTLSDIDRNFALHLKTPFIIAQEFAKRVQQGQIINILDTRITKKRTAYFAYLLAKKSLADFTLLAASELAPGIRVNGIAPGLILPPDGEDSTYLDRLATKIPAQQKGSVANIVDTLEFLVKNTYITGQIIFNDGGEHLS